MLSNKLKNYKVILASGSPRRHELLKDLDVDFTIKLKEVDEVYPNNLKSYEITDFLAELKSKAFEKSIEKDELIITSDTIVWIDDIALGKPKNYEDAFDMLSRLSNNVHEVITSVCILNKNFKKVINDSVKVYFKKLTKEEIDYYITTYKPYDKAGAYGIQEWIGKIGITKIEGSYFTVMGFPVHKLYKELMKL
ncbi:septum formation protein [Tenacibaculum sp. MAR_2010_89]|uniref:Maf family nucleotide pyrophosphatase n=1 Tax=Tenacibaculum sp. MAR_2010_89 TaxID=1250198 RepID=UPI00089C948C|nr:Maf family nucleotide pyrophosphatase [Tenacibaculum sp. MAR_2010_89]SEE60536.1 septum formation protein [Tenacibaculum sp. MAR_2010_89]